jgi:glycosyltransferase involved in cell wall biosynthesis
MPTADRRRFVPQAIRYFLAQDYPNRELVIVDDGKDSIADLVPAHPSIRYLPLTGRRSLGAKRNECVEAARGDLIMHWDDDDWMAAHRISYQVDALLREEAEVCGLERMLFYHVDKDEVWLYQYPDRQCPWLAGGSLLYTREFWRRSPFPNIQVASDTRFVWDRPMNRRVAVSDYQFYVAMIHSQNTSPKVFTRPYWMRSDVDLKSLMGRDLVFYQTINHVPPAPEPLPNQRSVSMNDGVKTYSILMVVHNALEMTRLSTLETLHRISGQDARLVVVDNASNDGTEQWLNLLAQRGGIDLIRSETNLGHGPALELARSRTRSPYLVALDSDAFPLSDDWLSQLRERLNDKVKVAGILHHRDYVHPSCLLVARQTLDELKLSFLNEKDQPSQFDVAERISHEVKQRGFGIAGLKRTGAQRRGSISEPVYLGSEYEGVVYHQWYTTRAATAPGMPVDDVTRESIDTSLTELFQRYEAQPRSVTVVMGIRCNPNEPERLANAKICLQALNVQTLPRWRYRIVVVEQDEKPRLENDLAPFVDKYVFAYNPGPYNRGWGFNIGAVTPGTSEGVLCLIDADLLVSPDFLARGLDQFEKGRRALLPYSEVLYLDAKSTAEAIRNYLAAPSRQLEANGYRGRLFSTSQGGCIWVDSTLYREIGGHDERFRGWGREDREFWDRLSRATRIEQTKGRQLHLYHTRPAEEDSWATANQDLYYRLAAAPETHKQCQIGSVDLYRDEAGPSNTSELGKDRRDWENWFRWTPQRITKIVQDEQRRAGAQSNRSALADLLVSLGDTLLDVGCGPGALWQYFQNYKPRFSWTGVDVTEAMAGVAHKLSPDVGIAVTDAGKLPFADNCFEVVLLRHVLEHLPQWLMEQALSEAMRVARRAVVVDFYVPTTITKASCTERVGDNFLETRWAAADIKKPIVEAGWSLEAQLSFKNGGEIDEVWIVAPPVEMSSDAGARLKVSIIMPTYRRSHTLMRTVQSVRAQTYSNWELIIIDNEGRADYRFNDPRISVHVHAERPSASYARNQGVSYARGELVCFFDDDDYMFPNYLEAFVKAFEENPSVKMVRCGMIVTAGRTNFSYATPECCLRREFVTPSWSSSSPAHDQLYFKTIVATHGWSTEQGDILTLGEALCHAHCDPRGGLRSGRL